jgi:hypothetical protein
MQLVPTRVKKFPIPLLITSEHIMVPSLLPVMFLRILPRCVIHNSRLELPMYLACQIESQWVVCQLCHHPTPKIKAEDWCYSIQEEVYRVGRREGAVCREDRCPGSEKMLGRCRVVHCRAQPSIVVGLGPPYPCREEAGTGCCGRLEHQWSPTG